jgi:hypothetical protein
LDRRQDRSAFDQDLKNLLGNAERKSVADVVEKRKAELGKRNAPAAQGSEAALGAERVRAHGLRTACRGRKEVAGKYDLSEETAKAKSEGVKGFKAHRLLDSKGFAKLGGMQRDGSVAIERYILSPR